MRAIITKPESTEAQPVIWRAVAARSVPRDSNDWQQELDRRLREAHEAGFRQAEAMAASSFETKIQPLVERLGRTIADLVELRSQTLQRAESDLVKLSIEIARRVLHRELAAGPAAIDSLVQAALRKLESQEIHRVRVHPDHQAAVRACLERLGRGRQVEVIGDATQELGAAIFDTARGMLDASVSTQLAEIERGLQGPGDNS